MTTELSSTTITNILEAVPGIKTVLRSPAADAMVNLTRAAAGISVFDLKDARELMRFAFRRGLINNEEHDRVLAEVEGAAQARQTRLAARKAARDDKVRGRPKTRATKSKGARPKAAHGRKAQPKVKAFKPRPKAARPKHRVAPKKKPAPKKPKRMKKPKAAKARKHR